VRAVTVTEGQVTTPDGRVLHTYDTGAGDERLVVVWHHGTPNIGAPPAPLFAASERLGIRWVGYDRPGYGGSTPRPGRDVASAAGDVAAVTGALGVERFAGMGESSTASLRAAVAGRAAKERYEASATDADPSFVPADWAALEAEWGWFGSVVAPAVAAGPAALIDDDLAYVAPWGFDPARVAAPALLAHGTEDRMIPSSHGEWLARRIPGAELRLAPGEGHISVLGHATEALEWLAARAG